MWRSPAFQCVSTAHVPAELAIRLLCVSTAPACHGRYVRGGAGGLSWKNNCLLAAAAAPWRASAQPRIKCLMHQHHRHHRLYTQVCSSRPPATAPIWHLSEAALPTHAPAATPTHPSARRWCRTCSTAWQCPRAWAGCARAGGGGRVTPPAPGSPRGTRCLGAPPAGGPTRPDPTRSTVGWRLGRL